MAESRERAEWGRFAALMALVANAHRDPRRSSPVRPERFNPYAGTTHGQTGRNTPKAPLTVLRDVFCRKGRGGEIKRTERIERPGEGR